MQTDRGGRAARPAGRVAVVGVVAVTVTLWSLASGWDVSHAQSEARVPEPAEFTFASDAARRLTASSRRASGLDRPVPVALTGTFVWTESGREDPWSIVLDGRERFQRAGGAVTHVIDGRRYAQIPPVPAALAEVAAPRIRAEFDAMAVVLLLRPPPGRVMSARVEADGTLEGRRVRALAVTSADGAVCTLLLAATDGTLAGWTMPAAIGGTPSERSVIVEKNARVGGVLLPVVQRHLTGGRYSARLTFRGLTGAQALREFK